MDRLKTHLKLLLNKNLLEKVSKDFLAESTSNTETIHTIAKVFKKYNYLIDPHTACGVNAYYKLSELINGDTVCLATAHYAKFPDVVEKAINQKILYPEV